MTKKSALSLEDSVRIVAEPWIDSRYYGDAEHWMEDFWGPSSPFREFFEALETGTMLELAVGYGRHAARVAPRCKTLFVMDVIEKNVKICTVRLAKFQNVGFVRNNGYDFRPVRDGEIDSIYCYDAMVHFSADIIGAYLKDSFRILKPGGKALFHHSNYAQAEERHYGQNPHARNIMSQALFSEMACKAGLIVKKTKVIDWAGVADLDCISLLERPI